VFSAEALFAFRGVAIEKSGLFFLPVYTSTDRHLFGMDGCGRESRDGENPSTRNVNIGWMRKNKSAGAGGVNLGSGEGIDDLEILKLQKIGVGGVDGTDPVFLH
jgi:hypothetical protein